MGASLDAVTSPSDLDGRIVGPGDIVTTDHRRMRLDIAVDANGIAADPTC